MPENRTTLKLLASVSEDLAVEVLMNCSAEEISSLRPAMTRLSRVVALCVQNRVPVPPPVEEVLRHFLSVPKPKQGVGVKA